jgi:hypothetical protein
MRHGQQQSPRYATELAEGNLSLIPLGSGVPRSRPCLYQPLGEFGAWTLEEVSEEPIREPVDNEVMYLQPIL